MEVFTVITMITLDDVLGKCKYFSEFPSLGGAMSRVMHVMRDA